MKYKNLTIIGTSHIAANSIVEVHQAIQSEKPDLVAVELDPQRLNALIEKRKQSVSIRDAFNIGIKAYIFTLIASYAQKKLGKLVGISPGSEMLEAVKLARQTDAKVALIDQDIQVTLRKLSAAITWTEKWHFVVDIVKGLIFRKNEMAEVGIESFDLSKVPPKKVIDKLIKQLKLRYPSIYKVLISERNYLMGISLYKLMQTHKSIVAVVGAGHEEEIINIIKKIESHKIELVR
jgi:pheromone shutdown-related protein TraB